MKIIIYLIGILFFTLCNSQKKETETERNYIIEKIVFSEANISEPLSSETYKIKLIQFSLDSVSLFTEKYIGEELVTLNKIRSYFNSNEKLFFEIPEKYLASKDFSYLNYYPENDGEFINVAIYINGGKVINWTLSYAENGLPQDLKPVHENFTAAKKKLILIK